MKRAIRWTLDSLAALSLLIALALLAIWISHALPRWFALNFSTRPINTSRETLWIGSSTNMLVVDHPTWEARPVVGPLATDRVACDAFKKTFAGETFDVSFLRFKWRTGPVFGTSAAGQITMAGTGATYLIPYGLLMLVFSLWPAMHWLQPLTRWMKARFIIPPGYCKSCGYDLRATPDRCPECGAIPAELSAPT